MDFSESNDTYLLRLHSKLLTRLLPNVHSTIQVAIDKLVLQKCEPML